MSAPPPAQTMAVACTPEPQKAKVFNIEEYKRQMMAQQAKAQPKGVSSAAKPAAVEPKKQSEPVKKEPQPGAVADLNNPGTPLMKVEAKFDFKGNADKDELTFEKGDFITVFGKASTEGWWVGRLQGEKKAGLLPANYVKLVKKFL